MYNARIAFQDVYDSSKIFELTPIEARNLKKTLLEMFIDIKNVCEKYDLCYMLCGGTLLGSIRHKGFIPWDDDFDILMPREDYDKIGKLLNIEFKDKYIVEKPGNNLPVQVCFTKIKKKGTVLKEIFSENYKGENGIFIDIFPLEKIPNPGIKRLFHGIVGNFLLYLSGCTSMYLYSGNNFKHFLKNSNKAKTIYRIKMFCGFCSKFFLKNKIFYITDKWLSKYKSKKLLYYSIPTGRKHYFGEILNSNVFLPVKECVFEGIKTKAPNDFDLYLKNLYNNYLELPPENKREKHLYIEYLNK